MENTTTVRLPKKTAIILLVLGFINFLIGAVYAYTIRRELFTPGFQIIDPSFFSMYTKSHGLIMSYFAIYPIGLGLMAWLTPVVLNTKNILKPRLVLLCAWGLVTISIVFQIIFYVPPPQNKTQVGWTFYSNINEGLNHYIISAMYVTASSAIMLAGIIASIVALNIVAYRKTLWPLSMKSILACFIFMLAMTSFGYLIWIIIQIFVINKSIIF